jgi:hypothetical protein
LYTFLYLLNSARRPPALSGTDILSLWKRIEVRAPASNALILTFSLEEEGTNSI